MLAAIAEADAQQRVRRAEKLYAIAAFIVDSYRHDPELMKVIIVEVTRAANTFGRTHLAKIREAYDQIAAIVAARRRRTACSGNEIDPAVRRARLLRADRAGADGLDLRAAEPVGEELERAKTLIVDTICRGLEGTIGSPAAHRATAAISD